MMPTVPPYRQTDTRCTHQLRTWEVLGGIWILIVGSLLHSVFEWTGHWLPIAVVAPVNESVWEHCKLAVWPGVWFAFMELVFLKKRPIMFVTAKCLGLCSMPLVIIVLFYGYTAILGDNYVVADIGLFVVSIIVGQCTSYMVCIRPSVARQWHLVARIGMMLLLVALCVFSFFPPRMVLFEHDGTGTYGILERTTP